MNITRIRFSASLTLPDRLKLPPALPCLPKAAIAVEGYKVYAPDDMRRLVGFYLPKRGIYNLDGERVGKTTSARRGCRFVREKLKVYLVDENNRDIALVALQKLRVALDRAADRIVAILQPTEFKAPSYDIRTARIRSKIAALLRAER